jgi:mono/diheme cytochrome c family protein
MKPAVWIASLLVVAVSVFAVLCPRGEDGAADTPASRVARGKYIVNAFGCTDCHTRKRMGPKGPEDDPAFHLAGHDGGMDLPPAPVLPEGPWIATVTGTMTAWSGPWGTSFTANLTPDEETGLGRWTEDTFVKAIRTGRHMGMGRPILPPMPVAQIANLTDDDLRAIFAYLRSIPPVKNRVPEPLPPVARP